MKKYLLTFLFLLPVSSFASTLSLTPSNIPLSDNTEVTLNGEVLVTEIFSIFAPDGSFISTIVYGDYETPFTTIISEFITVTNFGIGDYKYVYTLQAQDPTQDCSGLTFSDCAEIGFADGTFFTVTGGTPAVTGGLFHFKPLGGEVSSNPVDLMASVGSVSTDTFSSALPFMILVIGVGVAFYILQNLKKVIPADKKENKKYDIVPKKSIDGTYHATFVEREK